MMMRRRWGGYFLPYEVRLLLASCFVRAAPTPSSGESRLRVRARLPVGGDEGGKPVVEASSSSAIAGEKRGWESESDGESGEEEEDEDGEDSVVSADAEQPTAKRRRVEDPFLVCGL